MLEMSASKDEMLQLHRLAAREMMEIARDHAARSRAAAQTARITTPVSHAPIPNRRTELLRKVRGPQAPHGAWPRLMRAATAAAYVDEVSVETFRNRVRARVYSGAVPFPGRGDLWLRDDLDADIDRLSSRVDKIRDAADVL